MLAEYYSLADYSFVSSYSEELIEVQGILSLPAADMFDSLAAFLDENPSFDINRKLVCYTYSLLTILLSSFLPSTHRGVSRGTKHSLNMRVEPTTPGLSN